MTSRRSPYSRSIQGRMRSTARDVRALGVGAPLRAGYEASKRLGGHTLVFRHLVPQSADATQGESPFEMVEVPEGVRRRTIAAADRIVGGTIELFGQDLHLGDPPPWHAVIHTEGTWPAEDWWRIDLRSDDRPGDVKWAWELGRHRHLVILARGAHLEPSDERYLDTLERQLRSWIDENPPETGVHWYSNLEIALRSIAWLQILALAEDRLSPKVRSDMWRHLHHSGRHLIADLPYTLSTMRNNHLLGDALGLVALGRAFGGTTADRWYAIGNRIFNRQLSRHMRPDGSMIEDSLSYHRFVLEMLSMRVILGGASREVRHAMSDAAQFLARLGVLEGPVPQYGDWDEGRVFSVAGDPTELRGSVLLALALCGSGAPDLWRAACDEVGWFAAEGAPEEAQAAEQLGNDVGGGTGRAAVGPFTVWLKAGSGPSHGHADLSSVAIAVGGRWLIGDPGTATYNGPINERNRFRSSPAHDVVRVQGHDQLEPHRVFRWKYGARGVLGDPVRSGGEIVMWCAHDAYTRLDGNHRVARVVSVNESRVTVRDFVSESATDLELALPIGPECRWDADRSAVVVDDREFAVAAECCGDTGSVTRIVDAPSQWSSTYGSVQPSTVLRVTCSGCTGLRWSIAAGETDENTAGGEPLGTHDPSIKFTSREVRLATGSDQRVETRVIRL